MLTLALLLAAPQTCTTVKQPCRACTKVKGQRRCSTIGIACQPVVRVCRPEASRTRTGKARTIPHDR